MNTPGMHEDYIRDDGTISDTVIETYYEPIKNAIQEQGKAYIRIQCDANAVDSETRIPHELLINMGWKFIGLSSEPVVLEEASTGN